jgi:hypothetical protein
MSRHFHPAEFLRSAPNALLQQYFSREGLLADFDWKGIGQRQTDGLFAAIKQLDQTAQDKILRDFDELDTLAGLGFTKALIHEASFHGEDRELHEQFDSLRSHLARAFWAFLHRKEKYWEGALVFHHVDKIPPSQWRKRRVPPRPGPVDDSVVEELKNAIIGYFTEHEARGRKCEVRAYRRGEEEIFYAFPEDHKQTIEEFVEERLQPHSIQPPFEIIFKHDDRARTLEIHAEGDPTVVPKLQVAFATSVLQADINEDEEQDELIYEIRPLLSRDFVFRWSEELEIEAVSVKAMRITIEGAPWRRFTIEADPKDDRQAIYDLLDDVTVRLQATQLRLDQITLKVSFSKSPRERRASSRQVVITAPSSCRTKYDERGEQIHRMLVDSGVEYEHRATGVADEGDDTG